MLKPIPINKGVFANADTLELSDPSYAAEMRNLVLTDSGANTDRPGLASFAATGTAFGIIGLFYFKVSDTVVAVDADRRIWSITSAGVVTEIGGLALGGTSRPTFEDDGELLAIAGGGAPQTWAGTGSTTLMAGSPVDCTHINYLDGYWITHLLNDQEFRFAGPTSATRLTWNSGDFFQAEGLPDNIVAQAVLLRELYSFGSRSTEIFQNFGTTNPFQRTFFVDRGIGAAHSLIQFDNTLAWLDNRRRIVQMQGRTPVQIDNPYDRVIQGFSTVDDCWAANVESIGGFYFAVWTFPTEQRSFAYDYKNQQWYEWDGFRDGGSARLPIHSHVFVEAWNKHLVGDPATGNIYRLTFDAKTDGTQTMRRLRRTGAYNHGTNTRKRSNYYLIDVKRGVGRQTGVEFGYAILPDGDTSQIDFGDSAFNPDWNTPWSVSLRAKIGSTGSLDLDNLAGDAGTKISLTGGVGQKFVYLGSDATNRIRVYFSDTPLDTDFHHVLVSYDGSGTAAGITVSVDGSAVSLTVDVDNLNSMSTVSANPTTLHGTADATQLGMYVGTALDAGEVSEIYTAGAAGDLSALSSGSSLTDYYPLNGSSSDQVGGVDGTDTNVTYTTQSADAEPVFQVRVNDDNKGWSDPQLVPLGMEGSEKGALRVKCRGIYRKRELEIQMTDAAEFLLVGIEEDVELMNS